MAATIALAPAISHATSADYVEISRSTMHLGDTDPSAVSKVIYKFNLTDPVTSGNNPDSAALVLEVLGADFGHNEMYINPLGGVNATCDDDTTDTNGNPNDGNQNQSIGYIRKHTNGDEYFTSVKAFDNSHLQKGANTLLICARGEDGDNTINLDDFVVQHIMLHYKNK